MRRRAWVLLLLAVTLLGALLVTGPTAQASDGQQIDLVTDKAAQLIGQSDDGNRALFLDTRSELGLYVADLATGRLALLAPDERVSAPVLSADGSTAIWDSAGDIRSADLDTMTERSEGLPTGGIPRALSADASVLLYGVPDGPPDAFGNPTYRDFALIRGVGGWYLPDGSYGARLSRDGTRVAYLRNTGLPAGHTGVYRMRLGNEPELLLDSVHRPEIAGISADGSAVAIRDTGASVVVTPTATVPVPGDAVSLSADGAEVAYADNSGAGHVRTLLTGADVTLTPARQEGPFLSGDGSTAAWITDHALHVAGLADGRQRLLCCDAEVDGASVASSPAISFDGSRITFVDGNGIGPLHTWLDQGTYPTSTTSSTTDPTTTSTEAPTTTTTPAPTTTTTTVPRHPALSVSDAQATEGRDLFFRATLDAATSVPTWIQWSPVVDPSADPVHRAVGGVDYESGSHLVRIEPGQTEVTLQVHTMDDPDREAAETMRVHIDQVDRSVLDVGRDTAIGTIVDDDPIPTVTVAATHVAEDAGRPMTWTLTLDHRTYEPVTVRWWTFQDTSAPSDRRAAPDKDFKPAAGSVTFAPGETARTASSPVFDDSFFERDEWFVIELFDPTGATIGTGKATGTINDDESGRLWGLPTQMDRLLPA
jgi:hypothetical protein